MNKRFWKTVLLYAGGLAVAVFAIEWLEYRYLVHDIGTELYVALIAAGFAILGVWIGRRLTGAHAAGRFEKNAAALRSLGITDREYAVLELLAAGQANKEIARELHVSPNTVKTHVSRLYEKLEVGRRTQAVHKAKALRLIP